MQCGWLSPLKIQNNGHRIKYKWILGEDLIHGYLHSRNVKDIKLMQFVWLNPLKIQNNGHLISRTLVELLFFFIDDIVANDSGLTSFPVSGHSSRRQSLFSRVRDRISSERNVGDSLDKKTFHRSIKSCPRTFKKHNTALGDSKE
jgi:hypothetical protein